MGTEAFLQVHMRTITGHPSDTFLGSWCPSCHWSCQIYTEGGTCAGFTGNIVDRSSEFTQRNALNWEHASENFQTGLTWTALCYSLQFSTAVQFHTYTWKHKSKVFLKNISMRLAKSYLFPVSPHGGDEPAESHSSLEMSLFFPTQWAYCWGILVIDSIIISKSSPKSPDSGLVASWCDQDTRFRGFQNPCLCTTLSEPNLYRQNARFSNLWPTLQQESLSHILEGDQRKVRAQWSWVFCMQSSLGIRQSRAIDL